MLDVRYSHLYFYQSLNRLQRGLSAIAELLVSHSHDQRDVFLRIIISARSNVGAKAKIHIDRPL